MVTTTHAPTAEDSPGEFDAALDAALDRFMAAAGDAAPAVLMLVEQPSTGRRWTGARGHRRRGGERALATDGFRVASVAKTFTAALVIELIADGEIAVDDPVEQHLPEQMRSLLQAIPAAQRSRMTIGALLQHTSGVHDFGTEREYLARVHSEPGHEWTAEELVDLSMRRGPMAGEPGAQFHYSDTGYTLLASAAEAVLERPLPAAYRRLLDRAGIQLGATWLEGREAPPADAPPRLHQYLGGADTFDLHPSCDTWGGGGLVSTCADLAVFIRSLFAGAIVADTDLLAWMLQCDQPTDLGDLGRFSGRGVFRTPIAGVDRYGHEGYWGVWMHHYPELDLTVTGTHTGVPVDEAVRRDLLEAPVRIVGALR